MFLKNKPNPSLINGKEIKILDQKNSLAFNELLSRLLSSVVSKTIIMNGPNINPRYPPTSISSPIKDTEIVTFDEYLRISDVK